MPRIIVIWSYELSWCTHGAEMKKTHDRLRPELELPVFGVAVHEHE